MTWVKLLTSKIYDPFCRDQGCSWPGSLAQLTDNTFQSNVYLRCFSMNLSGLLLISGRCPFSLNVFLLRASSKPDCLRLWEMCDPLLIFMGIPGIPKTLNKDFYFFFLGSILLRTFMFVCTSPASRLLPCFSLSASRSWCLGQQRGELTRAHGP